MVNYLTSVTKGSPLLNDTRGEFRRVVFAEILCRMDRSGWNEQDVARFERHRRFAIDLIFQRAFKDIDNFFTRMRVPVEGRSRFESIRAWTASRRGTARSCR